VSTQSPGKKATDGHETPFHLLELAREKKQRRTRGTTPSDRWRSCWLWSTAPAPEAVAGQTGETTAGRASLRHSEETTTVNDHLVSALTVGKSMRQVHEYVFIHPYR
jgi:hypothetical protein